VLRQGLQLKLACRALYAWLLLVPSEHTSTCQLIQSVYHFIRSLRTPGAADPSGPGDLSQSHRQRADGGCQRLWMSPTQVVGTQVKLLGSCQLGKRHSKRNILPPAALEVPTLVAITRADNCLHPRIQPRQLCRKASRATGPVLALRVVRCG
jgi:hypothetical protein